MDIDTVLKQLTVEEKAQIVCSKNWFETINIPRLNIQSIAMYDGPNGLRKNEQQADDDSYGGYRAVQATCFPTGSAMANSWNTALINEIGHYMGIECQQEHVPLILGPAINMKRTPLCGRNFEYYSEDPYLAGKLAAAMVKGIQDEGVGANLKHFAANNQECMRLSVNAVISERALREIYLRAFEIAVKESHPYTIMCSYNKINGLHASRNKHLLKDILKDEWKFEGFVISDWGAMKDRVDSLRAGLDLEMPASGQENVDRILDAIHNGTLCESDLDDSVRRILSMSEIMLHRQKENVRYDPDEHHHFAQRAAEECMVLLRNENMILPLKPFIRLCVLGEMAENLRFQGGGSSHIHTTGKDDLLTELKKYCPDLVYSKGYHLNSAEKDETLIRQAVEVAKDADFVLMLVHSDHETEGTDRYSISVPQPQIDLFNAIKAVHNHIVLVPVCGSAIDLRWADDAKAILLPFFTGQGEAHALARILFGAVSPSGKLAESFPLQLEDNPSYLNYDRTGYEVQYREDIYIGYRYYDKKNMAVAYPFGHGLSYSSFAYSNLKVPAAVRPDVPFTVTVDITNTGSMKAGEAVQLYVSPHKASHRPVRELKGFQKVHLEPGETETISFQLDSTAFSWYNDAVSDWQIDSGKYTIEAAASSRDIRCSAVVEIVSEKQFFRVIDEDTTLDDVLRNETTRPIVVAMFEKYAPGLYREWVLRNAATLESHLSRSYITAPFREARLFSKGALTDQIIKDCIDQCNRALHANQSCQSEEV